MNNLIKGVYLTCSTENFLTEELKHPAKFFHD